MTAWIRFEGLADYAATLAWMEARVDAIAAGEAPDAVLFLEHAETITVGRHRGAAASVLAAGGVPVVDVSRGGDATWHGPGQLVAYPLVALPEARRDLRAVLGALEEAVIDVVTDLGLSPRRDPRNTGVWLPDAAGGAPRKVCSLGIAVRRWVTWHGLALNVAPDLGGFARIRPCGFDADVMTRLADHLRPTPTLDALVPPLQAALARHLQLTPAPVQRLPAPGAVDPREAAD